MGCELKNFEQTNHEVIVTGDLWVGQAETDWVYNSGQVPNRHLFLSLIWPAGHTKIVVRGLTSLAGSGRC